MTHHDSKPLAIDLNASRGVPYFSLPPAASADRRTSLSLDPTSKGDNSPSTSQAVAWAIRSFMEPVTARSNAPGESHRAAGRGDETLVDGRMPVVLQGFSQAAHGTLDEAIVVRDPLAVEDGRVERLGVAQEDVLRPSCDEQVGRPVRKRVLGEGQRRERPGLDLGVQLVGWAEDQHCSPDHRCRGAVWDRKPPAYKSRGPSSTSGASVSASTSLSKPSRSSRRVNMASSPPGVRGHAPCGRSQYSSTPLPSGSCR